MTIWSIFTRESNRRKNEKFVFCLLEVALLFVFLIDEKKKKSIFKK